MELGGHLFHGGLDTRDSGVGGVEDFLHYLLMMGVGGFRLGGELGLCGRGFGCELGLELLGLGLQLVVEVLVSAVEVCGISGLKIS